VLALQRTAGNAAVASLLSRGLSPGRAIQRAPKHKRVDVEREVANPSSAYIDERHRNLIGKFEMRYEHHNDEVIFVKADAAQDEALEAKAAKHWYRAMNEEEFDQMRKNDALAESDSFGGIATNRAYPRSYMTNLGLATHLVEFLVPGVFDAFRANHIDIKAEGGGGTFGLGAKGTQNKSAGGEKISASDLFNDLFGSIGRWRLVNLRIPNRLPDPS
jgi:hypothetical protein